mgnify:CR=1 FL=1
MDNLGIFGAFEPGNFGDDLMAIIFGCEARKIIRGNVIIYGLSDELAKKYGFQSVRSIDQLVDSSDLIAVCGGGGLCIGPEASGYALKFIQEIAQLMSSIHRRNLPFAFFSMGGNGLNSHHRTIKKMLSTATHEFSTVRLKSDLMSDVLSNTKVKYAPDVVLLARFYANSHSGTNRNKVVFNVSPKEGLIGLLIGTFLSYYTRKKLVFAVTHSNKKYQHDFVPPLFWIKVFSRVEIFICNDPIDDLSELSTWSTVISSKLHLGMAALSLGAGFCSSAKNIKVRQFFLENETTNLLYSSFFSFINIVFKSFLKPSVLKANIDVAESETHVNRFRNFILQKSQKI